MVPHPLHAMAILLAGEDVEAHFRPAGQTLRDLDGLVFLVVGGIHSIDHVLLPLRSVVGMELNHGAFCFYRVRAIDLNLIVALRASRQHAPQSGKRSENPDPPPRSWPEITHSGRAS